ncbi:MAG TPA: aspartyl/asparaginyl beta-hydroxylase domain-containing protein [Allosphingosinicella sp.]
MAQAGETEDQSLLRQAAAARAEGRLSDALNLAAAATAAEPASAAAWNMLGLLQLAGGDARAASASLQTALRNDPSAPGLWLNLARACGAAGDYPGELASLDQALARDQFLLPAILAKGKVLARLGREEEAVLLLRSLLAGIGDESAFPAPIRPALAEARAFVTGHGERRRNLFSAALDDVAAAFPNEDLERARRFAEQRAGQRKVFVQQPTAGHFPYLPAFEFFAPSRFPWLAELEQATDTIRSELLALWAEDVPGFRPYVAYAPDQPVNQWEELNHSPKWSAYFLWEDGVRSDEHCARCPQTAALLERLPLLDVPGKAPTAMFSILQPRTRIPPHTGSTNVRTTVHLPLVVPEGCGFRVGSETRQWREGEAWAFDDTIEHEAWNDSDRPRAILIVDAWNPLLSEAERAAVRAIR